MCDTCGCGDPEIVPVEVSERILVENDRIAGHNREHFDGHGVLAINLMGSPGSGKTALLERTAQSWTEVGLAALSGDLATARDGERLAACGIPALSITTGSACHLDARLVHRALHELPWQDRDVLFVENVGNLVCPAIYDLGQHANVVALSVTEGEDKPLKYPVMFHRVDLVVVTKVDLVPHLPGFSFAALDDALLRTAPGVPVIRTSAVTGEGVDEWLGWLADRREQLGRPQAMTSSGGAPHHHHHHG